MPEGPEVKRNAVDLSNMVAGKNIEKIDILSGRYTKKPPTGLDLLVSNLPDRIIGVGVHGKFMYILLRSGNNIWSTLGMSGVWSSKKTKHSRIQIKLEKQIPVFFNDVRNFGTFKIVYGKDKLIKKKYS